MPELVITAEILAVGTAIFLARIVDVSLGTIRVISIVNGRKWMAFGLGFIEILIWITVVSTVIQRIKESPALVFFYALGFASGNMVGIEIEKKLALGNINFRAISRNLYREMAASLREAGYPVTIFKGEGRSGPVGELYVVCTNRNLNKVRGLVRRIDPEAFYTTEPAVEVSKIYRSSLHPVTGWRAIFKKK